MPQYRRFTAEDAIQFANQHSELFGEHSKLTAVSFFMHPCFARLM